MKRRNSERVMMLPLVVLFLLAACGVAATDATLTPTPTTAPTTTALPRLPDAGGVSSGLGVAAGAEIGPAYPFKSATGPVLPLLEPAGGESNMALLAGELVVAGRCLYLVDAHGIKWLLTFPADAVSWERDTLVLGGERIPVGETVTVGGGERQNLSALRYVREPDDSCDAANIWVASQLGQPR